MNEVEKYKSQVEYVKKYAEYINEYEIYKLVIAIHGERLKQHNFVIENSTRYDCQIYHLGVVGGEVMRSDKFDDILARCNKMMIDKWDNEENYLMYKRNFHTLEKLYLRGDFVFETYDNYLYPKDIERLITDILGEPSTEIVWNNNVESWEVTTPLMSIKRFKNGNIKIKGLTVEQWKVISDKVKFFNDRKRKTV